LEDNPKERRAKGLNSPDAANLILEAVIAPEEERVVRAPDEVQGRRSNRPIILRHGESQTGSLGQRVIFN